MTTQNILLSIDNDLNYLAHYNVKGSHWRQHDPNRRWQRQAVYANGQPNPDAKASVGDRVKNAAVGAKNAVVGAKARFDAKQDAAIKNVLADTNGGRSKGARRVSLQGFAAGYAADRALYAPGRAIGIGLGAASAMPKAANASRSASLAFKAGKKAQDIALTLAAPGGAIGAKMARDASKAAAKATMAKHVLTRAAAGGAIGGIVGGFAGAYGGRKIYANVAYNGYKKRGEGTLKGAKVSDAYRDAYKKTFDKYVNKYAEKTKLPYGRFATGNMLRENAAKAKKETSKMTNPWQPQSAYARKLSGADFDGDTVPKVSGRYVYGIPRG